MKIKVADIVLICILTLSLIVLSIAIYIPKGVSSEIPYALVKCDNKVIDKIYYHQLVTEQEYIYHGKIGEIKVVADQNGVKVYSSSCSDKICVKQGKLTDSDLNGKTIACLPNLFSITIVNGDIGVLG